MMNLLFICAVLGELLVLPSAAPDQPDSSAKIYLYWVKDGQSIYEVAGFKVLGRVWYDPLHSRNLNAKRGAYQQDSGEIGPLAKNQGVNLGKSTQRGFQATTPAGKDFAHSAAKGAPDVTERRLDMRLTIYGGTDAERERVLNDLKTHPALAAYKDRLAVQSYEAGHWAVDPSLGYPPPGTPTIMLQALDGFEYWRAENYNAGPEGLAASIAACRKRDPDYDPNKTPGPGRNGSLCPLGFTQAHLPVLGLAGIFAFWFLRKEETP